MIELVDAEKQAIRDGRVIEAVKLVRVRTGAGLSDAKGAVDQYRAQIAKEAPARATSPGRPAPEHPLKRAGKALVLSLWAVGLFWVASLSLKAFPAPIPAESELERIRGTVAEASARLRSTRPVKDLTDALLTLVLTPTESLSARLAGGRELRYDNTLPCYRSVKEALRPGNRVAALVAPGPGGPAEVWQLESDGRLVLSYGQRRTSQRTETLPLVAGVSLTLLGVLVLVRVARGVWPPVRSAVTTLTGVSFVLVLVVLVFDNFLRPLFFTLVSCP